MNDITIIKTAYLVLLAIGPFTGRYTPPVRKLLVCMRDRIAQAEGKPSRTVQDECSRIARHAISIESTLRYIMARAGRDHVLEM